MCRAGMIGTMRCDLGTPTKECVLDTCGMLVVRECGRLQGHSKSSLVTGGGGDEIYRDPSCRDD